MGEQLVLPIGSPDSARFDNFYSGRSAEVVDGLQSLISGEVSAPYYVYGPEGSGKSHLVFAVIAEVSRGVAPVAYLSLAQGGVSPGSLALVDPSGWVCIDDVDAWAGQAERERELFALFERVRQRGGVWLATGAGHPADLGLALDDLASRLGSGVVYRLHELKDAEREEALQLRAKSRGFKLGDDAIRYLMSRTSRSTADLFALLDRIDRASLVEGRRVTVPFLRTLL